MEISIFLHINVLYCTSFHALPTHRFGEEYQKNRDQYPSVQEFFRDYDPPMVSGHYTCYGLSAHLSSKLANLEKAYPGLKDAMYLVRRKNINKIKEKGLFIVLSSPICV